MQAVGYILGLDKLNPEEARMLVKTIPNRVQKHKGFVFAHVQMNERILAILRRGKGAVVGAPSASARLQAMITWASDSSRSSRCGTFRWTSDIVLVGYIVQSTALLWSTCPGPRERVLCAVTFVFCWRNGLAF